MGHKEKVEGIKGQVRQMAGIKGARIKKREVSHFVPNAHGQGAGRARVDISDLNEIISIDPEKKICIAEPGAAFCDVVRATLRHGLIPCTVPELKTITLGGAVSGCSVESMSYRHGGFHDSCIAYEIVTGRGEAIECTTDRNADLFHMVHGSYGTLGVITKITFKLLPAKPFVKMEYARFEEFDVFWKFLAKRIDRKDADFVDAIVHGPKLFVACIGHMTAGAPYTNSYDWLNIFYKSTRERSEDYLKIDDYFFRYDAECHWLSRTVPPMEWRPVRYLLGKMFLGSTNLIRWSKRLAPLFALKRRPDVVVDVFIPAARFGEFFRWYEKEFDYWPLWIVPYKTSEPYPWIADGHAEGLKDGLFIDCAIYGKPNSEPDIDYSEALERKTVELGGIKTLISRNHFDEDTFWRIYSKPRYDAAKARLDPDNLFGNLFEKMNRR